MLLLITCANYYERPCTKERGAVPLKFVNKQVIKVRIKTCAKVCVNAIPARIRTYLQERSQLRFAVDLRNDQFAYGGNRTCIRLVDKPSV